MTYRKLGWTYALCGVMWMVGAGCALERSSVSSGVEPGKTDKTAKYTVALTATTTSSLPKCTSALNGTVAHVDSPPSLWACASGAWKEIKCTSDDFGEVAYSSATPALWACVGKQWTQVALPSGSQGPQGPQGPRGDAGPAGPVGATGSQGPAGAQGNDGAQGPAGPHGAGGPQGADGVAGPQGPQGAQGPAGPAGQDGTPGKDGASVLVVSSVEPPGHNCANGGVRVDFGTDANGNGALDVNEVSQTAYVCNGTSTVSDAGTASGGDCKTMGMPETSVSGIVYAPNGTLPLYGVDVYVPSVDPGAFVDGAQCRRCSDVLPGAPIARTRTDETGHFLLTGVPAGTDVPVVIAIGKWRREFKIARVSACTDQSLGAVDTTLPKSRVDLTPETTRVDMPQIAVSTGSADTLECLIRKLGIADAEITTNAQGGKVHLFADTHAGDGAGTSAFASGFGGGSGPFSDSQGLWGTSTPGTDSLKSYDVVLLSCEGAQHAETKSQAAMDALKAYADGGGRVLLSHWHNIWIEGSTQGPAGGAAPKVWPSIATFSDGNPDLGKGTRDSIDELHNPSGAAFAAWMTNVMGSTAPGYFPIADGTGRNTCSAIDDTKAEAWVNFDPSANPSAQPVPAAGVQIFQFTTPSEVASDSRCGKVIFSDVHMSPNSSSPQPSGNYPQLCSGSILTPQEKALAFMLFEASSCVGGAF